MWPRLTILLTVLLATLAGPLGSAPARGHGDTITLTVRADSAAPGRLVVTASWTEDRHPVAEPVAATLTATGPGGAMVGPLPLRRRDAGRALYSVERTLPPGTWNVVAEAGYPSLGRGESTVTVTTGAVSALSAGSAAGSAGGAPGTPGEGGGRGGGLPLPAAAAAVVLAAVIGLRVVLARRSAVGRSAVGRITAAGTAAGPGTGC